MSAAPVHEDRRGRGAYAGVLGAGAWLAAATVLVIPPGTPGSAALVRVVAFVAGVVLCHRLYGRSLRSRSERGTLEAVLLAGAVTGVAALVVGLALGLVAFVAGLAVGPGA